MASAESEKLKRFEVAFEPKRDGLIKKIVVSIEVCPTQIFDSFEIDAELRFYLENIDFSGDPEKAARIISHEPIPITYRHSKRN